ncbi:MAG: ATP-binding protein [Prevotellaceae bacterium]|jgi:AAA+ ATPase superfamily predicted ATPase|nr:ATP-binding protein [Prevotellaceae bacterium]
MKFYNRTVEIAELQRIKNLSFTEHSRMTVVTGRRRIGKTSLIMKSVENEPTVYLFVGRKTEAALCSEYIADISRSLNVFIPAEIASFRSLFQYLMELGTRQSFNLVIDEFQEFLNINGAVYSDMQNVWDRYRRRTKVNLVLSGSVYSLMNRIFQNSKEPLFGRADNIIKLSPFDTGTLRTVTGDYNPGYQNDDLLALYAFTGGIPKYLEIICDGCELKVERMIEFMARENSPFIDEGKNLLIEEFGKNYGVYFSILSAVSGGINTQPEIMAALGDKSIGGQIKRLIEDYGVLKRLRPIGSKEGTQTVRYEITDNFLQFWFNYFDRHRAMIEIKNFTGLQHIIKAGYTAYSGKILERYFRAKLAESGLYREIGSWWEAKGNQNEIDIVALLLEKNKALAVEVKRQKERYRPTAFVEKVERLKQTVLPNYGIETSCLSLDDM